MATPALRRLYGQEPWLRRAVQIWHDGASECWVCAADCSNAEVCYPWCSLATNVAASRNTDSEDAAATAVEDAPSEAVAATAVEDATTAAVDAVVAPAGFEHRDREPSLNHP